MELSVNTIEILNARYGKGKLFGFENNTGSAETLSKEEAERIYDELAGNELIDLSEEGVHISALGHHILDMMISPEQFIVIDNKALQLDMKLYFRNTYYLSVLENKVRPGRLTVDLLPGLKEVVSAFVFAVYRDKDAAKKTEDEHRDDFDIRAAAGSWNSGRVLTNAIDIKGNYTDNGIRYILTEKNATDRGESEESECRVSEFVNTLTEWLFARLKETMAEREK